MPESRIITLQIPLAKRPAKVQLSDGTEMRPNDSLKAIRVSGWNYDAASQMLSIRFPYTYNDLTVTVN